MSVDVEQYEVFSPFNSGFNTAQLSKENYQSAIEAKDFLLTYMRLEENYLQVLYSLQDFEKFLTDSAIHNSLFPLHEFSETQDTRVRANIYVSSFLNSVTGFRNQFPRKGRYTAASKAFLQKWEQSKKDSVAFSFGERLRNYSQHQSHPVASITSGGGWNKTREHRESHVTVYCDTTAVASDRGELGEKAGYIREFGERADISLIIREVAGKVGGMVKEARGILEKDFTTSTIAYQYVLDLGKSLDVDGNIFRVAKISKSEISQSHDFFEDFIDRARALRRNFASVNNHQHFVSSRPRGHSTE